MGSFRAAKNSNQLLFAFFVFLPLLASSQYTDVINSNRPGLSVSAYAVGKNVIQLETGLRYEQSDHSLLNTQSNLFGADLSLRYGLLFESLEINYEGTFQNKKTTFNESGLEDSFWNFSRNRVGLKFLVYDRYKNPERNKPNIRSWRANNVFQLKNLIPSVSVYGGATFNLGENPFYIGDPVVSYRGMIATQSKLTPRVVFISNISYDRITSLDPEMSYLVSLSYAFRNPKWSTFVENQGIQSDRYADVLLRAGVVHLLSEDLQVDVNMGASLKNTPSRIFVLAGMSYRFDLHSDPPVKAIEDQKAGENGGEAIKKGSMLKKGKKKGDGSGAEDIDLGPSKKELRKKKKEEKRKNKGKKNKKKDGGVIEF